MIWGLCFLLMSSSIMAQKTTRSSVGDNPDQINGANREFKGFDSLQMGKDKSIPDTTIINYFTLRNIDERHAFVDTTLDEILHFAEPSRDPDAPLYNLGPIASASLNALYQPIRSTGFHSGMRSYEPYNIYIEDFKYYQTNRAISDLYFSGLGNQQNISLKADFSRNYANGIQFNINYQRYANQGFYTSQKATTTNLGLGVWYQSPSNKYNMLLTYASNVNGENHNGGITTDTLFGAEFAQFRTEIPVYLNEASSRYQQRAVRWSNYYRLAGAAESPWKLRLQYDAQYSWNYWNYDDKTTNTSSDTVRYQQFLVDYRGVRNYIRDHSWRQAAYVHGVSSSGISGRAGLVYDYHSIDQNFNKNSLHNLSLQYDARIPVRGALVLNSNGLVGFGDNAGSFDLRNNMLIKVGQWAQLKASLDFYRRELDWSEKTYWLNETRVYNYDFNKPFGTILSGRLAIPKLAGSYIQLSQIVENDPIYWNQKAEAIQHSGALSVTRLSANIKLRLGTFHLHNVVHLQRASESFIHLPDLISSHKLYWDDYIFGRKMNVQAGVIWSNNDQYNMQKYAPYLGRFYQGDKSQSNYLDLDAFVSFKVQSFRLFFQVENMANIWKGDDEINYRIQDYPYFDWKIRYGVRWMLFD